MLYLLERIAVQTQGYTIASGTITSDAQSPAQPDQSAAPLWALRVNGLWFASLIVSLATASLSMLVKQWLREYLAVEYTAPQERLRARQYRRPGLDSWKVFEIAAMLPMLLQVSLGLFFVGLCFFTANVDERMGLTSLPLVCGWALFVVATTFAPLISPRCPYKMPLLKTVMRAARVHVTHKLRRWASLLARAVISRSQHLYLKPPVMNVAVNPKAAPVESPDNARKSSLPTEDDEEEVVVTRDQDDKDILLSTDRIMGDDILLMTMWETFRQRTSDPAKSLSFVVELMLNRVGETHYSYVRNDRLSRVPNFTSMSRRAWSTFMEMLAKLVGPQPGPLLDSSPDWLYKATLLLLSDSPYPLPPPTLVCLLRLLPEESRFPAVRSIALWLGPSLESGFGPLFKRLHQLYEHGDHNDLLRTLWDVLKQRPHDPSKSLSFIVDLIISHIGSKAEYLRADQLSCVPELTSLSWQMWSTLMEILAELASTQPERGHLLETSPDWLKKTALLFLSSSPHPLPDPAVACLRSLILDAPGLSAVKPISRWIAKEPGTRVSASRSLFNRLRRLYERHGDKDDQDTLLLIDAVMAKDDFLPHTWTSSDPAMHKSYKPSSLPLVVDFVRSRLGEEARDLTAVRLNRIPDFSSLSHRTWDTVMDILADLASCRRPNGTLQSFNPDWLQKTTVLLLSSSTYPLPASAVSCLRDILSEATHRDLARWTAQWLATGHGQQRLAFRPLSSRLRPIYEAQGSSTASMLTVCYMYAQYLRPYCRSPREKESLRTIMAQEPGLFEHAAARPILQDLWNLICSALLAQKKTGRAVMAGSRDSLSIIIEFAERMDRKPDAVVVLSALWENWAFSYLVLIHASAALHPVTKTSRAYALQLGTDAFSQSSAQAKLVEQSTQIANQFALGAYDDFVPMDMIRFCFLHVKLYAETTKQDRPNTDPAPQPSSTNDAAVPSAARREPPAWARLWYATNAALREYYKMKGWQATYNGSNNSMLPSPAELLTEDRKLAGECLELIGSLERPGPRAGEAEQSTQVSVFPDMLITALGLFVVPEDVSRYPRLAGIQEQQKHTARQSDAVASPKALRTLGLPSALLPRSSPPERLAGASGDNITVTVKPGHDSGVAEDVEAQSQTVDAREGAGSEPPSAVESPRNAFSRAFTFRSTHSGT
ncbi:hypothetical protein PsYK624_078500 [Phanerochaete sordida]|uniref:DUF6535 domain-containing protein n=1 Tax=Phanerochaete sordida TaxID=48140 RepID=A0A9P3GBP2_9APHY|nr:hypothetical protein PsYK624_078500 [Phanerochaete sordida]